MSASLNGRYLPEDYIPCDNTVIIGRGKRVKNHEGNLRFVEILKEELEEYTDIKASRSQKSGIIRRVIERVRENSFGGYGFVKRDPKSGRWSVLEDLAARTSVGQGFRDLHPQDESKEPANGGRKPQFKQARKPQSINISPTKDLSQVTYNKVDEMPLFSPEGYSPVATGAFSSGQNNAGNTQGSMMITSPAIFSNVVNNSVVQRSSPIHMPNPCYSGERNHFSENQMSAMAHMAAPQQQSLNHNLGGSMMNYDASQQSMCNAMAGAINMNMNMHAAAREQQNDDVTLQRLLATFGPPEDLASNNPFEPLPVVPQQPLQNQDYFDQMSLFQAIGYQKRF